MPIRDRVKDILIATIITMKLKRLASDFQVEEQISLVADGLPNYFDNQRFGSVGESGAFLAKAWCLGDYERALWLALAEPNVRDRPEDRTEKQILRDHWGHWSQCAEFLRHARSKKIVDHL